MDDLTARYTAVTSAVASAAKDAGAAPVRLLAVSKTHPVAALRAVFALGQRAFGENYAQELAAKAAALSDLAGLELVFIGRLQSNKIALIVGAAAGVQSLGNERHARLLARAAEAQDKAPYPVHLLINAGGEASKDGVAMADAAALAQLIERELPALDLRGIMAIPPPLTEPLVVPPLYRELRRLADQIGGHDLSLGMSNDLHAAIAAGSNCVRIGSAIFGERTARLAPAP